MLHVKSKNMKEQKLRLVQDVQQLSILVGFAPDMNYLTLACISNVTALAY